MKTASTALKNLLSSRDFVYVDLYTFTLADSSVVRLSGGDTLIKAITSGILATEGGDPIVTDGGDHIAVTTFSGDVFSVGTPIMDGGVKASIGTAVNPVEITMYADAEHLFNGQELQPFIRARGLVGAQIQIDRAYAKTWEHMIKLGPVGVINRFLGRYGGVTDMGRTQVKINAYPMTYLLNAPMPADVYQANCANVLYDEKCTLDQELFKTTGTCSSGCTATSIASSLSNSADYFALGKIVFTSGANAGLTRTVKSDDGAGNLTFVQPLKAAPAAGDAFKVYAGCPLTWAVCGSKFSNQVHFRGEPKVPPPEASL